MLGAGFRIIGEFAGESGEAGGAAGRSMRTGGAAAGETESSGPRVGLYKDLSGNLPAGSQANHLNQDAVYGGTIPSGKGFAVEMQGDANADGTVDDNDYTQFYTDWQAENAGWTTGQPDPVRIGFGGYIRDPVSELLLARNRWYEPVAGRWVTRDPAGYVDGLDLYLYAKGNPLSLVDPTGLKGEEWHHALPQEVFLNENGKPKFSGIDPNDKDFGRVMRWQDHRGGKKYGNPSNKTIHDDYNKHWDDWIKRQQREGKPITRESVSAHLAEIEGATKGELKPFAEWLSKGVKADRSFKEWGNKAFDAAAKEKWFNGKVEEAQAAMRRLAKEAEAAGEAAGAAKCMTAASKTLKALGWIGMGAALLYNAEEVYAGNKCWQEGMIDTISPIEVQDTRNMQTIVNEGINNWQGNTRARIGHMDSTRSQPGCGRLPGE